jgi:hypothetical protein
MKLNVSDNATKTNSLFSKSLSNKVIFIQIDLVLYNWSVAINTSLNSMSIKLFVVCI